MAFEEVTEENVYTCTGQPLPTDIAMIVEWMLNESYEVAYQSQLFKSSPLILYGYHSILFLHALLPFPSPSHGTL